jgi:ABC-2 type transport system permease protein
MSDSAGQGAPPMLPNAPATGPKAGATGGPAKAPSPERALRRLFLTLFLRGRTSRGLRKESVPKSVASKLAWTLIFYAGFGLFLLFLRQQPVFALSVYLHGMTFVFLGMFVAASAGEVLFNKDEADILLHRPVTPGMLLRAKVGMLVQVSLWLAGAFNIGGFIAGVGAVDGGWFFIVAHALSTCLEALFCTACVVLTYQLCLRWFGRERLEGLMTTVQVFVAIAAVLAGQVMPRMMGRFGGKLQVGVKTWWVSLLPPAWFAGLDDALAGSRLAGSWALAAWGLAATAAVLWLAFGKLAGDYGTGLQTLGEARTLRPRQRARRRWLGRVVAVPPLRWWLRDSVSRASFLLTAAYLLRDRDTKLRVYPSLASMLVMPVILLVQDRTTMPGGGGFGVAFVGTFLGIIPVLGLSLVQYSQHWQAADLFRAAPIAGPAPLCNGARRAVLCLLTLPVLLALGLVVWLMRSHVANLALLLPGIVVLPVYALLPNLGGKGVPLSLPTEEAKSSNRGMTMIGAMAVSGILSGIASFAWSAGWFGWLLGLEIVAVAVLYMVLRMALSSARWPPLE